MLEFKEHSVLIEFLRMGDERAFSFLIQEYHHLLCVFAFGLIRDEAKSQDIVQNVFLKVWEHRAGLNPEQSLKAYLHKLTYNEFVDTYRRQKSMSSLEERYFKTLNSIMAHENSNKNDMLIELVNSEINKLPEKCRRIFVMSKKEGLTNQEISQYLNISVKTVEGQITKAFSRLRKQLRPKIQALLFLVFKGK